MAMRYEGRMRVIVAILFLLAAGGAGRSAAAQDVLSLVRSNQWDAAAAAAASYADPVAAKLVRYYRMLTPGAASAAEITGFLMDSPDWPNQALLTRRRDDALALEADDGVVLASCDKLPAVTAGARVRCADAMAGAGRTAAANTALRQAWVDGVTDAGAEARFLQRAAMQQAAMQQALGIITPDDDWRRFARLAETDDPAAGRQLLRLDAAHRQAGDAVLALRHNDPRGLALAVALPPALRHEPFVVLEEARWLRRAEQDDAAVSAWQALSPAAMAGVAPDRQPAFWTERHLLARRRLRQGDAAGAYALAAAHGQSDPEQAADGEFLAGWIALRRLGDPGRALAHFQRLASLSNAVITQARAHYWIGRAAQARNDKPRAAQEMASAAAWPTTYYGQLAAIAAGDDPAALTRRIVALRDPAWDDGQAIDFAGREVARAAALLVSWGEPDRARAFLLRLEDLAPGAAERAMAARLAAGFGMTDQAVTIARRAGRDGVMLPGIGWPSPYEPPNGTIEPSLALGVIRQESNFNLGVVSPAGARGLMQLMPGTAQLVARLLGTRVDNSQLTSDPAANMKLGTAYMQGLMAQFGDFVPMAVAAYNAGPGRAVQWARENGDPRTGAIDPIDWVELIPFNETRNYVQRVIENVVIYRARRGVVADHPTTTVPRGVAPLNIPVTVPLPDADATLVAGTHAPG